METHLQNNLQCIVTVQSKCLIYFEFILFYLLQVAAALGKFQMAVCDEAQMNPALAGIKENIGNLEAFR